MKPFEISRIFDAPRDKVWKAWTDPVEMKKWWGPAGFKVHTANMDLRPGGSFHYGMRAPDGSDMWGRFTYKEIEAPKRLVFLNAFSDAQGGITRHPYNEGWPLQLLSTILFEEKAGKTTLTVQWVPAEGSTEAECRTFDAGRASMNQGWGGTMDQFAGYLRNASEK